MPCCSGLVCSCIIDGDGVTTIVTGIGSTASPYVVTALIPAVAPTPVTAGSGIGVAGLGTLVSPFVVTNTAQSGDSIAAAIGVTTMPRALATNAGPGIGAGIVVLTGLVPQISFTAGHINVFTSGAGTSPTSAFIGLYSVAANGDATLLCTSASTTAIGTGGVHKVVIPATALVAGNAYYVAQLNVGGGLSYRASVAIPATLSSMTVQPMASASNAGGSTTLPASITGVGVNLFQNTLPGYYEVTT